MFQVHVICVSLAFASPPLLSLSWIHSRLFSFLFVWTEARLLHFYLLPGDLFLPSSLCIVSFRDVWGGCVLWFVNTAKMHYFDDMSKYGEQLTQRQSVPPHTTWYVPEIKLSRTWLLCTYWYYLVYRHSYTSYIMERRLSFGGEGWRLNCFDVL